MVIMAQSAANWRNTHTHMDRTHSLTHLHQSTQFTTTWCEAPAHLLFFSACWVCMPNGNSKSHSSSAKRLHKLSFVGGYRRTTIHIRNKTCLLLPVTLFEPSNWQMSPVFSTRRRKARLWPSDTMQSNPIQNNPIHAIQRLQRALDNATSSCCIRVWCSVSLTMD